MIERFSQPWISYLLGALLLILSAKKLRDLATQQASRMSATAAHNGIADNTQTSVQEVAKLPLFGRVVGNRETNASTSAWQLSGIFMGITGSQALLIDDEGNEFVVEEGGKLSDGSRLKKIGKDYVIILENDNSKIVWLPHTEK